MAIDKAEPDRAGPDRAGLIQTQVRPDGAELKMVSDPAVLGPVRKQVERFAREAGFSDGVVEGVGLAVNEAMANVIRHQYRGATDQPMQVTLRRHAPHGSRSPGLQPPATHPPAAYPRGAIEIAIRDWGTPFDPQRLPWGKFLEKSPADGAKKDPDLAEIDVDQLKPGGLGLLCMRRLMDEVRFEPQTDGMLLTLIKTLPDQPAEPHEDRRKR